MTTEIGTSERVHARYSPSQSERFFNCLGSTNQIAKTPARAISPYALEGQIAHDVLEAGLRNSCTRVSDALKHSDYAEHELAQGYHDFHYSIQDALDHVWNVVEELDLMYGDVVLFIERKVDTPSSVAPGETGGYLDIAIFSAMGRVLYVMDYKHGVGVAKAVVGNTQVKQYAAGLLYEENPVLDASAIDRIILTIIQPRAFHPDGDIRSYETTPLELVDYLIELDEVIEKNEDPTAPLNPGVSWCQFCPASSSCPALAQSSVAVVLGDIGADVPSLSQRGLADPKTLDISRLAYIKSMKPMIMLWLNSVEDHVDELSRAGWQIPGFKRVESQAKRRWHGDRDEIAYKLAALIGCEPAKLYKEPALLNITDAEPLVIEAFKARVGRGKKKLAAEAASQAFAYFTLKESSGNTTLVPLEDRRPAINKVEQTFGSVGNLLPPPNPKR